GVVSGSHFGTDAFRSRRRPMHAEDADLISIDLFTDDESSQRSLDEITRKLLPNPNGQLFEYTAQADADQRAFIDCQANTIRLLAPAGSGKTQSIVNRVMTKVSRGEGLQQFLILTFDRSARTSLQEKFTEGLKAHGVRGTPSVMTLNSFGYGLFR